MISVRLFDPQFKTYFPNYILQSLTAVVILIIILTVLGMGANLAIVASIGASSFIIFAMPKSTQAQPRHVIGGHAVGLLSGSACYLPFLWLSFPVGSLGAELLYVFTGAIAVGMAIFLMSITDTEHAPAAGTALGIVAQGFTWQAVVFVLSCVLALSLARWLLRAKLRNLTS
ncbi:HPP family protein [Chloroflexota bacterium]